MCKLETLYLANDDVEDRHTRVDQHIPPALSYACRFSGGHLDHTGLDLFDKVEALFEEKFFVLAGGAYCSLTTRNIRFSISDCSSEYVIGVWSKREYNC